MEQNLLKKLLCVQYWAIDISFIVHGWKQNQPNGPFYPVSMKFYKLFIMFSKKLYQDVHAAQYCILTWFALPLLAI